MPASNGMGLGSRVSVLKRRGILAGVAALMAGAVTKVNVRTAHAAPEDVFTEQTFTPTAATTFNAAVAGSAIIVNNSGGIALNGRSTGGTGAGVNADSTVYHGLTATSSVGFGVFGTTGTTQSALYGNNSAAGPGVSGTSSAGIGVVGTVASNNVGVYGSSGGGVGVYGTSGGVGVLGSSTNNLGVQGTSTNSAGVYGTSVTNNGVYGYSQQATGVVGESGSTGVYGFSAGGVGLLAQTSSGVAGRFLGAVQITGNTNVGTLNSPSATRYNLGVNGDLDVEGTLRVQGQKSAVVPDSSGQLRTVYCMESPDSIFEDFGEAQLVGGSVYVAIDPAFREITRTGEKYFVFLTPTSDMGSLYVTNQTEQGFTVYERGGTSSGSFCYRVVARRRDIDAKRLAPVQERAENQRGDRDAAPKPPERPRGVDRVPEPPQQNTGTPPRNVGR